MKQLKNYIKVFIRQLKKYDWYYQIRYINIIQRLIGSIVPEPFRKIEMENQFYRDLILDNNLKSKLVFDIGASVGQLTEVYLSMGYKVVAVEPDLNNIRILKARFGNQHNLIIIPEAISDHAGEAILYVDQDGTSLHTISTRQKQALDVKGKKLLEKKVKTITLNLLLSEYGIPGLLKLDIEGHEKAVLLQLDQVIPIIVFEVNLPLFLEDCKEIMTHIYNLSHENYVFNFFSGEAKVSENNFSYDEALSFIDNTKFVYLDVICIFSPAIHLS